MHEPMQSAYRSHHSTETALVRVCNDILCAVDERKAVILILLDLSAAFDTIDHEILIDRLRHRLGISGTSLEWFRSYLADRTQSIHIQGETSGEAYLHFGVPQGSVMGPLLFILYTAPLGDIARRHGLELHLYADDTQVYITFQPKTEMDGQEAMRRINACVAEIRAWMIQNLLQINDGKTEAIVICSPHLRSKVNISHLEVGAAEIVPSDFVRNIGAFLDQSLNTWASLQDRQLPPSEHCQDSSSPQCQDCRDSGPCLHYFSP